MIETKNLSFIYREEDMESGEIKEEKVLKKKAKKTLTNI